MSDYAVLHKLHLLATQFQPARPYKKVLMQNLHSLQSIMEKIRMKVGISKNKVFHVSQIF